MNATYQVIFKANSFLPWLRYERRERGREGHKYSDTTINRQSPDVIFLFNNGAYQYIPCSVYSTFAHTIPGTCSYFTPPWQLYGGSGVVYVPGTLQCIFVCMRVRTRSRKPSAQSNDVSEITQCYFVDQITAALQTINFNYRWSSSNSLGLPINSKMRFLSFWEKCKKTVH